MKAWQAPPQAVDRPFELTLLAVDDGLVDNGDALPMPVPQLGKEGLAALQTGDGVIQTPDAQVGLADIVERDGFTAAIAVPPGGAEGQLVDRLHLRPVRPYHQEPVHHLGEAGGEAGHRHRAVHGLMRDRQQVGRSCSNHANEAVQLLSGGVCASTRQCAPPGSPG